MPNQQNKDQVKKIKDQLQKAKAVIMADYTGLSVSDQTELRAKVAEAGGEFTVQKNTLLKIALKERLEDLPDTVIEALNGPTGVLYGYEDAVSATKALVEFSKDHEALTLKMGVLSGNEEQEDKVLTMNEIKALADLPNRDQLIAKLVGQLNAPVYGLVNVLSGNLRGLVQVLNAIKDQKESNS